MKKTLLLWASLLAATASLVAQSPDELDEGIEASYDAVNDAIFLSWWSHPGKVYFISESEDLDIWTFKPIIEPGSNQVTTWGVATNVDRMFFKLVFVDGIRSLDPWSEDFDGDGLSNYHEILLGMNPFEDEGAFNTGADDDGDLVVNGQDAAPNDDTVGQLSVSITFPAHNSTLN